MITVPVFMPSCSFAYFAHLNNVSVNTVRGWADKGHIPTHVLGKHRVVNLARLTKMLAEEEGGEVRDRPDD